MLWQGTVTNNKNDNDGFHRDTDILHFKWREQFTHGPRPATRHRPDSDAGRSNVGPTSGRQSPSAARAGGATASEIGDPGPLVSAINPHTNH